MKIALVAASLILGGIGGEWLTRFALPHAIAGGLCLRGELVALVGKSGIFDADLRALQRERKHRGGETDAPFYDNEQVTLREELIALEVVRRQARLSGAGPAAVERNLTALHAQFDDDRKFHAALRASAISEAQLHQRLVDTIGAEAWIEKQITPQTVVPGEEARRYFENHQEEFMLPVHIHVRHIFLAAPQSSLPEFLEAKQGALQDVLARLNRGENFEDLAAAVSEDAATKARGGDLGFFGSNRVPPEFFAALGKLPIQGPAAFIQTHLGFHAVQIIERRPPRSLTVEEVLPEIGARLAAQKREDALDLLRRDLAKGAHWLAPF